MSSYTLPQPRYRSATIRVAAAPRATTRTQDHVMKLLGWATVIVAIGLLAWLSAVSTALWARALFSLLLATLGLVFGMRVATRSTSAYIADLQRVNKLLCDQQSELEEVNAILLKQVNSESATESTPKIDKPHRAQQQRLHG